eukprot:CAMPEP_0172475038 /NCGR_PEP_ID=MMETSP1065-20121228/69665_1 /TAXON_ID=265537 /ORGANISM="Amphiprora paludosa, Strain CCMP125" /LENGTH=366 /DNA_ID=CAMNT_0013233231 /DNA_START=123 /DNA_END=1223 /DNA_ORIENTATION=+
MGSGGRSFTATKTATTTVSPSKANTTTPTILKPSLSYESTLKQSSSFWTYDGFLWCMGMLQASCFSMVYFVVPLYLGSAVGSVLWTHGQSRTAWAYATPLLISAVLPPVPVPFFISLLKPMLQYFDSYEQIIEVTPVDTIAQVLQGEKNYILAAQPHGVVTYNGILGSVASPPELQGQLPTAVADVVLWTPILKHVIGIFGLISASKKSLVQTLTQNKGLSGTVMLYVGGMAELFLSDETEERLYLKNRKGFIKLSLQTGVDVIPVYLFGNTTVLSILKTGLLPWISRKLGISLTYMWGKWYLPIPRNDCKLLYVSGQPIGIPHIPDPTQADIDKYHEMYCQQVQRLFESYKEKVPEYKHKTLHIV